MLNIIKADLYRIFRGKAIYITFAVLIAFILVQALAGSGTVGVSTGTGGMDAASEATNTNSELMTKADGMTIPFVMAGATDNLVYFLLPFIIFFIGADFSSGAVKNALSRGVSRTKYYFAKLIPILILAVIIQLLNLVLPIIVATIRHGFGGGFTTGWLVSVLEVYGAQIVPILAIACVGIFLVFLTKKTSTTIATFLAFLLVPTILCLMLAMISPELGFLSKYDLIMNLRNLASLSELPSEDIVRAFSLCTLYIVGGSAAGVAVFRKSAIK